jgi:hypothetical protein
MKTKASPNGQANFPINMDIPSPHNSHFRPCEGKASGKAVSQEKRKEKEEEKLP